jgi:hypothetical protein
MGANTHPMSWGTFQEMFHPGLGRSALGNELMLDLICHSAAKPYGFQPTNRRIRVLRLLTIVYSKKRDKNDSKATMTGGFLLGKTGGWRVDVAQTAGSRQAI